MVFFNNSEEAKTKKIIKNNIGLIVGFFALRPIAEPNGFDTVIKIKGDYFEKVGNSSGFLVSEKGLIATNYHPISDRKLVYKIF
jgi:S1-C subfamily serine protease